MSNAECEFVCRIAPVFQQSCDVVDRLRSYHDERFALRLMESASSELLGEVRFRAGASGLPQSITNAHVEVDDVRNVTSRDLDVVFNLRETASGRSNVDHVLRWRLYVWSDHRLLERPPERRRAIASVPRHRLLGHAGTVSST